MNRLKGFGFLRAALLCCLMCTVAAFATVKEYPLQGKIVARGTTKDVKGKRGKTKTVLRNTYTVQSPARTYVFQCDSCGKKGPAIDDVVRFRLDMKDKNKAYIQTDNGKEYKLIVLSETLNSISGKTESNP